MSGGRRAGRRRAAPEGLAASATGAAYRSVYVPVDNSAYASRAVDLAVAIARQQGARLTGSHVYAARLHDRRFRQMEGGLPGRYLTDATLAEQRDVHDQLIARGLRLISDSYLDVVSRKCEAAGLSCGRVSLEGRNWRTLVADIEASSHDLVIMGARGLGAVEGSLLGSVCERVARAIDRDLLVVKSLEPDRPGPIVAAIDGSPHAFGGLRTALELGRLFGRPVEAVSAFDPFFHHVAFASIAGVLSPEAAGVFRLREQERLHGEIIDGGLARMCRANLDLARRMAAAAGQELRTALLAGKAFEQVVSYAREHASSLLVVGRAGTHADGGTELGSHAENVLRLAPCDVLLSARTFEPPLEEVAEASMAWTEEAAARMARAPAFVRGLATAEVVRYAAERGHTAITSDLIDACLERLRPAASADRPEAPAGEHGARSSARCPFAGPAPAPGLVAVRRPDDPR